MPHDVTRSMKRVKLDRESPNETPVICPRTVGIFAEQLFHFVVNEFA